MRSLLALLVLLIPLAVLGCAETAQLTDAGAHPDSTAQQQVAAPAIAPKGGTYSSFQTVTITASEAGAVVYYTLDGSQPSHASQVYSAPFVLDAAGATTVKAIAVKTGMLDSAVASTSYLLTYPLASPTFAPASGTYASDQSVTITAATADATIYYTTDGGEPTVSSAVYSGPIAVAGDGTTMTIKAIAAKSATLSSGAASATYTISYPAVATPQLTPPGGSYSSDQAVTITSETADAIIYYTTDGSEPTTSSAVYSSPIEVKGHGTTMTIKALAVKSGMRAATASAAYTINYSQVASPQFTPDAGTYTEGQLVTITCATPDATVYYTTNGSEPTTSSAVYSSSIAVAGDGTTMTIKAMAVVSGMAPSSVASATYAIGYPSAAVPQFNPPAGTYSSDQVVTVTSATSGSTVYYTTDGSEPTTSSAVYHSPIEVKGNGTTMTIKAMATKSGMKAATASAAYTINYNQVASPQLTPAAGTYEQNQAVMITCATPGATIYYTTDGSSPSASSLAYLGPIAVRGSGSTKTIKAIALKSGAWAPSAIASATYTIRGCATGLHDGGDGSCRPEAECLIGYYRTADGRCVRFAAVATGLYHSCGLKGDDSIACWGLNSFGQAPMTLAGPYVSVTTGDNHTCVVMVGGNIACWGRNDHGEAPASLAGPFLSVSAGGDHTCGLRVNGSIACWGRNDHGEAPASLAGPFLSVSAGGEHTCAVKSDRSIACWGDNSSGQAPATVAGSFSSVDAGLDHTCAVKSDGNVACWGLDDHGQAPASVAGPFSAVRAGGYHTCALQSDGNMTCWGWNEYVQAPVTAIGPFLSLDAGGYHTCAVRNDGTVGCWGLSHFGQAWPSVYP